MNNKTKLKSYIFRAEIEQEEDGRWSAEIPLLPGCAAQAYIQVLIEDGKPIPSEPKEEVEIVEAPVVAVTV